MNLANDANHTYFKVAALLLPLLAAQAARLPDLAGPSAAQAQAPAPTPATKPVDFTLTPAQAAASTWLRDPASRQVSTSPMRRLQPPSPAPVTAPAPIALPAKTPTPAPAPPPADDTPRGLRVSSVMGRDSSFLISIDHKTYRLGDQVIPHWRITKVDAAQRVVVLTHDDGRTLDIPIGEEREAQPHGAPR